MRVTYTFSDGKNIQNMKIQLFHEQLMEKTMISAQCNEHNSKKNKFVKK